MRAERAMGRLHSAWTHRRGPFRVALALIINGKEIPRVYAENRLLDFIKRIPKQRVKDSFGPLGGEDLSDTEGTTAASLREPRRQVKANQQSKLRTCSLISSSLV